MSGMHVEKAAVANDDPLSHSFTPLGGRGDSVWVRCTNGARA
eukprot:COSAG02_NODE_868_length_16360_cov_12.608204_3_plen_42_part_00